MLAAGFLVMLAGTAAVPLTAGTAGFGIAATLLVLGLTTWMVPPVLLAERLPGGFRGPAAGVYRLVSDFAYIIAPGAVGWSIGRHGFRATVLNQAANAQSIFQTQPAIRTAINLLGDGHSSYRDAAGVLVIQPGRACAPSTAATPTVPATIGYACVSVSETL